MLIIPAGDLLLEVSEKNCLLKLSISLLNDVLLVFFDETAFSLIQLDQQNWFFLSWKSINSIAFLASSRPVMLSGSFRLILWTLERLWDFLSGKEPRMFKTFPLFSILRLIPFDSRSWLISSNFWFSVSYTHLTLPTTPYV